MIKLKLDFLLYFCNSFLILRIPFHNFLLKQFKFFNFVLIFLINRELLLKFCIIIVCVETQRERFVRIRFVIFFYRFLFIIVYYFNDERWYSLTLRLTSIKSCAFLYQLSFCKFIALGGRLWFLILNILNYLLLYWANI